MPLALGRSRTAPVRLLCRAILCRAIAVTCAWWALAAAALSQQPQSDATQQPAPAIATPAPSQPSAQVPAAASPSPVAGQAGVPAPSPASESSPAVPPASAPGPATASASASEQPQPGGISEDDLRKQLVGKVLYLRGGYLDDNLSFNEHGLLSGHSPQGSYTLSGVAIEKVRLTKHKVELEGQRYGLHFLGALPSEDPTTAMDRVLITPKKKVLRITIDRETVVTPKKVKEAKDKGKKSAPTAGVYPAVSGPSPAVAQAAEPSEADQAKAEMAAVPEAERPADPGSITTTTSPAHAAGVMREAIDHIFSVGFDDRMMAAMPDFWKLYYQAVAAKADYRPKDPAVFRQGAVDKKARLISVFEPASNEFAQAHGVAGLALYHVVIGPDGKAGEIAVARPIGFGLDESAADSIRKAAFEPAMKDGHPVPVLLDLIVEFHIYSARTAATSKPDPGDTDTAKKDKTSVMLPGPYSVPHS